MVDQITIQQLSEFIRDYLQKETNSNKMRTLNHFIRQDFWPEGIPVPTKAMTDELDAMIEADSIDKKNIEAFLYLFGIHGKEHPYARQNAFKKKETEFVIPFERPEEDEEDEEDWEFVPRRVYSFLMFSGVKGLFRDFYDCLVYERLEKIVSDLENDLFDEDYTLKTLYAISILFLRYSGVRYWNAMELEMVYLLEKVIVEEMIMKHVHCDDTNHENGMDQVSMAQLFFDIFMFVLDTSTNIKGDWRRRPMIGAGSDENAENKPAYASLDSYEEFRRDLKYSFSSDVCEENDEFLSYFGPDFCYQIVRGKRAFNEVDPITYGGDWYEDLIVNPQDNGLFTDGQVTQNTMKLIMEQIEQNSIRVDDLGLAFSLIAYNDRYPMTSFEKLQNCVQEDNSIIMKLSKKLDEIEKKLEEHQSQDDELLRTLFTICRYFMATMEKETISMEEFSILYRLWMLVLREKLDDFFAILVMDILKNAASHFEPYGSRTMNILIGMVHYAGADDASASLTDYNRFVEDLNNEFKWAELIRDADAFSVKRIDEQDHQKDSETNDILYALSDELFDAMMENREEQMEKK